jgi:hypothetical protein
MAIKIKILDGQQLYNVIAAGINNLVAHQKTLDEINVFPVPDGDTGTNMVFTLLPVISDYKNYDFQRADEAMSLMANTALDSARGNSGTIIAQFYYGLSKSFKNLEIIDVQSFATALKIGYESALDSLANPEEGTIITVMRDVAQAAELIVQDGCNDYVSFIKHIFKAAEKSLKSTKTILKILRKSDVVDSGALGYVLLIQGALNLIERGQGRRIQTTHLDISYEIEKIESLHKDIDFTIENKFCTECVVVGNDINRNELKSKIKDFGDSMVIAGSNKRVKVHIHTNEPAKLFKMCNVYGTVKDKKVDDMTKQEKSIHHDGASSIAIVTDSTADLPDDYLKEVQVASVKYSFGRQQHIDKVTQTNEEFYNQMSSDPNHPKTSQPTPRDFIKLYNFVSSHYKNIISIHLSKAVSGTYQSAINGSKNIINSNIGLIDSSTAGVGLGLLVMYAVDLKQAGKSYNEIISSLESKKQDTQLYLLLYDLTYAVRGGRLPSKIKTISDLFGLTPILTTKGGKLKLAGVLWGRANIIEKFSNFLVKKINHQSRYRILVAHANSYDNGKKLENKLLNNMTNIDSSSLLELGGGLGCHAGPGALTVGIQKIDEEIK